MICLSPLRTNTHIAGSCTVCTDWTLSSLGASRQHRANSEPIIAACVGRSEPKCRCGPYGHVFTALFLVHDLHQCQSAVSVEVGALDICCFGSISPNSKHTCTQKNIGAQLHEHLHFDALRLRLLPCIHALAQEQPLLEQVHSCGFIRLAQ